jgi:hypothetical protein
MSPESGLTLLKPSSACAHTVGCNICMVFMQNLYEAPGRLSWLPDAATCSAASKPCLHAWFVVLSRAGPLLLLPKTGTGSPKVSSTSKACLHSHESSFMLLENMGNYLLWDRYHSVCVPSTETLPPDPMATIGLLKVRTGAYRVLIGYSITIGG